MNFPELTQAFLRHDNTNITEFVQRNQKEIKLLFLNASDDSETQALVTESFLALLQRQYSEDIKASDEFQSLANQFALYFKKVNLIGRVNACKFLCIHEPFRKRIEAFIFTRQYNHVNQHIERFAEYLNLISQASDSEDSDFTTDVIDDIADYYLFGKEQLASYGQANRVQEFEALFENEDLIREHPVLSSVVTKLFHRFFNLPVRNLTDKIYEPSRFTERFFETKFISPIRIHPRTNWHKILLGFPKDEIRYDIIKLGQTNFDKEYGNILTSKEIVMLYCYFNMRKHYYTSLSMFERLGNLNGIYNSPKRIKFIDIGCGPATSGIALVDYLHSQTNRPVKFDYFGVDIAASMRETAKEFLSNEIVNDNSIVRVVKEFDELDFSELTDGSCILINTCYLFASPSLDIPKLATFVNEVRSQNKKVLKYLLFQNPDDRKKNKKYFRFKELIEPYETTYSEVDTVFYNNKRNSPFEPTSEHVFYELLKL